MIPKILDFRLKQFWRILKEIGAVYFILLFVVCVGFFLGLVERLVQSTSMWTGPLGAMIVLSIHFSRKDTNFLKKLEINRPKLYILEYLLMSSPLVLAFLGGQNFGAILVQTAGILIISFLPNPEIGGHSFSNKMNFSWLPKEVFELKSYLRRAAVPIMILYVLGLLGAKYITIMILMVLATAMFFTAFFDEVEGKALFEAIHFRKGILWEKTKAYLGIFYFILLPYIALFLIVHLEYWYIMLAALFLCSTYILFNIFYKYAHYTPYRRRINNSMASSIFFMAVIIPFFYPVTLLYLIYYWRKARKNICLYYAEN